MRYTKKLIALLLMAVFLVGCTPRAPRRDAVLDPTLIQNENYTIISVSDDPLFAADGSVNSHVLDALVEIINDPELDPLLRSSKSEWSTGASFDLTGFTSVTARDFSNFVTGEPTNMSHSGAIVIRLFETIPNRSGVEHGFLTEFTSQWWQLVYRVNAHGQDVLTLWMMQPYRLSYFSGNRYEANLGRVDERYSCRITGDHRWSRLTTNRTNTVPSDRCIVSRTTANSYFFDANYSASIARSNLLRDMEHVLEHFNVGQHIVAPRNLPGEWQSSHFQTGSNYVGRYYVTGQFYSTPGAGQFNEFRQRFPGSENRADGLGAAGLIWGRHLHFSVNNGKDGLGVGPVNGQWANTINTPTHDDLLWLPSDFEIRSMGHGKDLATFQTFITDPNNPSSELRWNWNTTQANDWRTDLTGGRSGLWELNGFDRGFRTGERGDNIPWPNALNWLRTMDVLALGSANTVCHAGNRYTNGVNQLAGLRPGIHLCVNSLIGR